MSDKPWTGGRWTAWESPSGCWYVQAKYEKGGLRHTAFIAGCESSTEDNEAHCRLFSAAPDLAEALHNAVALWAHRSTDDVQQVWLAQARAALAKAKGAI